MSTPVLVLLAFAAWTVLVLLAGVGIFRWSRILAGRAQLSEFRADVPHGTDRYRRAMRAHQNCVENLPVYGAVVFAIVVTGVVHPLFELLPWVLLGARVLQSVVHIASGTNRAVGLRFAFFFAQLLCMGAMGAVVAVEAG